MAATKGISETVQLMIPSIDGPTEQYPAANNIKPVTLERQGKEFGFALRHFVVYPPEVLKKGGERASIPRVNGTSHEVSKGNTNTDPLDTVFVRQVTPSGPADRAGLSTGDQIISVNGQPVLGQSYAQVIQLIQTSKDKLELGIIPKEDCVLQTVTPTVSTSQNSSPEPVISLPSNSNQTRVTSTITFNTNKGTEVPKPNSMVYLKLSDSNLGSFVDNKRIESNSNSGNLMAPPVVTRRSSLGRESHRENRAFVVTSSDSFEAAEDTNSKEGKLSEQCSNMSPLDRSYFFAATDHTGKSIALHVEKGSSFSGDKIQVVESAKTKARSHSLPLNEMESFQGRISAKEGFKYKTEATIEMNQNSDTKFHLGNEMATVQLDLNANTSKVIPPFILSTPSTSDNLSTSNVLTDADSGSRQPIATHRPGVKESSSFLAKALEPHLHNQHSHYKSTTIGSTLLESKPSKDFNVEQGTEPSVNINYEPETRLLAVSKANEMGPMTTSSVVIPSKHHYEEVTSSFAFCPNEKGEITIVDAHKDTVATMQEQDLPPRRISYLLATQPGSPSPVPSLTGPKLWSSSKRPHLSAALSSTLFQPVMIQTPQGSDLLQNSIANEVEEGAVESMEEDEVTKEGLLWKKQDLADGGKRSSARSWKPVFAVLRGHVIFLYKDKSAAAQGHSLTDEQPISIKSSIVDIAHDYTKRKYVFRLTTFNGSEYLFQTEDRESMMSWIGSIQANNNPDEDERGITSQSLIIRKMKHLELENSLSSQSGHKLSPPTSSKMSSISNLKKSLSFKNISGGQSLPFSQHKKGDSLRNHWNKASKKRKKPSPSATSFPAGHSVGVPLELCPQSKDNKGVPLIVEHCTGVIERKGLDTVGVYRVPGNSAVVNSLVEELNTRGAENVNFQEDKWNDVNNTTSLLKQMLRNLPEGIVTAELYDSFLEANKKEDAEERMWALRNLVHELPEHHFETLKYLIFHLKSVSENSAKNKMEVRNLAIVFGPTLVRSGEDTMMSMVKDMSDQCRIVETLITCCEWFYDNFCDGENANKPIPVEIDVPQEQLVKQSILQALGQNAETISEDKSHKVKKGHPPHTFPKPKMKHPRLETSASYNGSKSSANITEEQPAPLQQKPTSDLTASSSQTNDKVDRATKKQGPVLSTTGNEALWDMMDGDIKQRGGNGQPKFTPRAYSYAHPPPPSYRKVNTGNKRPVSPLEGKEGVSNDGGINTEAEPSGKSDRESPVDTAHPHKPNFAFLSEGTRLRLLKASLQQKAAEKKQRERDSMSPVTTPVTDHPPVQLGVHQKGRLDGPGEPLEQTNCKSSDPVCEVDDRLSSSGSSSSTPSSKNASLDSLHHVSQQTQPPWVTRKPELQAHHPQDALQPNQPPWVHNKFNTNSQPPWINKATSAQTHKLLDQHQRRHQTEDQIGSNKGMLHQTETKVEVVQGKGIVTKTPKPYDAPRRLSSSDIRARRESAEDMRLRRGSCNSESSDSSDSEGDEGFALSMSKTFDEKLRDLLDLNYYNNVDNQRKRAEKQETGKDEDTSSLGSDTLIGSESALARESTLSQTSSRTSDLGSCSSPSFATDNSRASNSSSSGYATTRSSARTDSSLSQASALDGEENGRPSQNVHLLRQQFESEATASLSDKTLPPPYSSHGVTGRSSHSLSYSGYRENQLHGGLPTGELTINVTGRSQERRMSEERKTKIGVIQTTTPVSLKEFTVAKSSQQSSDLNNTAVFKVPRKSLRDVELSKNKAEKSVITVNQRKPLSGSEAYSVERKGKSATFVPNQRMLPATDHTFKLPAGSRSNLAARKQNLILPSRGKVPGLASSNVAVGNGSSQAQRKLDRNAQHIKELLNEVQSERYLKMNRQQSDISSSAQKAAALRAAARRRRRSLGDETRDPVDPVLIATRMNTEYGQENEAGFVDESGSGQYSDRPIIPRQSGQYFDTPTMSRQSGQYSDTATVPRESVQYSNTATVPRQSVQYSDTATVPRQSGQYSDTATIARQSGQYSDSATMSRQSGQYSDSATISHQRPPGRLPVSKTPVLRAAHLTAYKR